jgi:hypothetical protein
MSCTEDVGIESRAALGVLHPRRKRGWSADYVHVTGVDPVGREPTSMNDDGR